MLCERCKQNQATTHIKQNINGVISEMNLCEECANELSGKLGNYGKLFSDFGFGIDSMLGSIFGQDFLPEVISKENVDRCPMCQTDFATIRKTGNVGCSKCYEKFREQLTPLIARIHGKTVHSGRVPSSAESKISVKNKLSELENELKQAIDAQEFEKAAKLRDQIAEIKKSI